MVFDLVSAAVSRSADADALVIFGITGDLARKMTFQALYLLSKRHAHAMLPILLKHTPIIIEVRPGV